MCNHYRKNAAAIEWAAAALGAEVAPNLPDFVADTYPKTVAPIAYIRNGAPYVTAMRWGMPVEIKHKTHFVTNARDDRLSSFTWRSAVASRRCLIPASGYCEPQGPKGATWEVLFAVREQPFFIAGIWCHDGDDEKFAMVTTSPNRLAIAIDHDRMPLVLAIDGARQWLGTHGLPPEVLARLCQPFPAEEMSSTVLPRASRKISKADLSQPELPLL